MKKLLLIDGSSLLHRAFYALPLLSNSEGMYTNAVHGFMMMFNRVLEKQKPDHVLVAFDKSRITFRNEIDPQYKGNRSATPPELKGQFELIKEVLDAASVRWWEQDGYEADDILGTLSARGAADGMQVEIVSGDRDVLQLVDDKITVFMTKKGISDIQLCDVAALEERYGLSPAQLIDVKALMGDSSDNIPGVPGVGEKTALKLIKEYRDLDSLYENIENIKGKLGEKLADNKEQAYRCRALAAICRDMPLDMPWDNCVYDKNADKSELAAVYRRLGLNQLLRALPQAEIAKEHKQPELKTSFTAFDDSERPWAEADDREDTCAGLMEILELCEKIKQEGSCGILCCWEGPPVDGGITRLAIALPYGQGLCVDVQGLSALQGLLEDPHIKKHTANSKELRLLLNRHHILPAEITDDIVLADYLLDPAGGEHELAGIASRYGVALPSLLSAQASVIPHLAQLLREKLAADDMLQLYTDMELPLAAVLADMEQSGVRVEGDKLASMSLSLAEAEAGYQKDIFAAAGREFNINSPKQLGAVLFDELGIPPMKKTKTGYSTNAEVLEALADNWPIARSVLDYRMAAKLRSTYTDGLRPLINPHTGKIHTSYKQTVTATGRLSSAEPNLQNIPVRHELGRKIRQVFTADGIGHMLVAADYNQIELRVLAHMSGDAKFIEAFRSGEDIHTRTAAEVLGIAPENITAEQRRRAKAVNFGIVYGISDYGLAQDLHISRAEAADYIALYFQRYPAVAEYQKQMLEEAREKGYVSTLCGRRRWLPDLNNRNFNLRSLAERMAINAPIQGTAADIIKLAMIRIQKELKEEGRSTRMIMQVHDELIFDVPMREIKDTALLIREKMEHAMSLSVPLTVDIKAGADWYDMEKI